MQVQLNLALQRLFAAVERQRKNAAKVKIGPGRLSFATSQLYQDRSKYGAFPFPAKSHG